MYDHVYVFLSLSQVVESPSCVGAELPPPALSLFGGTQAGELGCIGRSTRFGRALWCLAKSSMKTLELFTGIGGEPIECRFESRCQ